MLPQALIDGHKRFCEGRLEHERKRYERLATIGQTPSTMIIGCCDSRAAPETIFDAGPGEVFVVRNVANLVPPYAPDDEYHGTSAALEFAVQALKVQHIVVLGHGRCGGIAASLQESADPLSPGDFIGKWITLIEPAKALCDHPDHAEHLAHHNAQGRMERASIINSIANLMTFPCIKILVEKQRLHLHGAWFDISEGALEVLNQESGRFERLI